MRVLVTGRRAGPLASLLQARGLEPVHVPLLALEPTGAPPPPGRPDAALVTSAAAPELAPGIAAVLAGVPLVAVGARTAAALRAIGLEPVAVGRSGGAAAVELLRRHLPARGPAWHVGAEEVSPPLAAALARLDPPPARWAVYRNVEPPGLAEALAAALPVDAVALASGSAARRLVARGGAPGARIAVIGAPTARACREVGLPVHAVAAEPTMEGLAEAVARALGVG